MSLQEDLRDMATLLEHRGWKKLMEYAEQQIRGRTDEVILTPAKGLEGAMEQEFMKGEIGGIRLFCTFPEAVTSDLRSQLKKEEVTDGE